MSEQYTDDAVTLDELKRRVLGFAKERDWLQFHTPKNLTMALAAEVGELLECFLWKRDDEALTLEDLTEKQRAALLDEIADTLIYTLELANVLGVDLAKAVDKKMQQNAAKYPVEKAKGNALKYTEL